ncbi:hypothetical protein [Aeromicrobium sp. 179-A 4D2 NHS]|uniref:hypothetical protein n=1 Tax=Aeromicrobium sp. 179-A 4D2 NHS TaxID=3142375 RepID=UPI0039A18D46
MTEPPPLPEKIERTRENPYGRTEDWPYGFHANDKPRKAPIRLLSAFESLLYWFLIVAPIIFLLFLAPTYWPDTIPWDFRPTLSDGATWFDTFGMIIAFGWLPFGLIGNVVIRLANKYLLQTDSRRPSQIKAKAFGMKTAAGGHRGYTPPTGKGL